MTVSNSPNPPAKTNQPRRRLARWLVPLAVVVALIAGVSYLPGLLTPAPDAAPPVSGPPILPRTLPNHSLFTAPVSQDPTGPAIALYGHGGLVDGLDVPQAIAVGRDGRTTRRVDLAEDRGGNPWLDLAALGIAPMLLSPDGTKVAVGALRSSAKASLAIVDLSTGDTREVTVGRNRDVEPLAWSPDLRQIAYVDTTADAADHEYRRRPGKLVLLDLRTGTKTTVPGVRTPSTAAWSPDSTRLAVQNANEIRIVDLDGRTVLDLPAGKNVWLNGTAAWSPDGAWLAALREPEMYEDADYELRFLDPTGSGRTPPKTRVLDGFPDIVGWRSADALLIFDTDDVTLYEHTLNGGHRRFAAFNPSQGDVAQPHYIQLATNLLPDLRVEDTGDLDRGPWPWWAWVGSAFLTMMATTMVLVLIVLLSLPYLVRLGRRRARA